MHECFILLQKEMHPGEKTESSRTLARQYGGPVQLLVIMLYYVSNASCGFCIRSQIKMTYKFLQLLQVFKDILSMVNKISEQPQDPNLDLVKAWQLISMLKKELECIRNFEHIKYKEVEKVCRKCGISIEGKQVRSQRPPESLSDYAVTDAIGKSAKVDPEVTFHANAFVSFLDCMLSELDRRFSSDAKAIMEGVLALSTTVRALWTTKQ